MKRLIVLLGVAGVSLSAVFVRWSTAPSLILALYRMAFSAALMAVPVLAGRRRELKSLTRRDVLLCLASGLFLGIHFAAYFGALRATSIASAVGSCCPAGPGPRSCLPLQAARWWRWQTAPPGRMRCWEI